MTVCGDSELCVVAGGQGSWGVPERPVFRLEEMEDPPPCRC